MIVQHIRDFLNNRSHTGSNTNIALYMQADATTGQNPFGTNFVGSHNSIVGKVVVDYVVNATTSSTKTTKNTNTNAILRPH